MEKIVTVRCGDTDLQTVSASVRQLEVWSRAARRQAEAISRAAAAADAISMIWDRLDVKTRMNLEDDTLIRERIRHVTGYYGFSCS